MAKLIRATRPHMPGYGLALDESSLKPWGWAEEVLRAGHNYWLGSVTLSGRPHAMPVWGVWHLQGFWFSTGNGSRKARNLAANAACTVGTERGTDAVIVEGVATRLAAGDAPPKLARLYAAKYGGGSPDDSPLFRVAPHVVFGFSEAADEFGETATRWRFGGA